MVYRRGLALRPINSIKKVIDSVGATVASTVSTTVLADATDGTAWVDAGNTSVPQGCHIKSIFISIYIQLDESIGVSNPIIDLYIAKSPGDDLTFPEPGATGGDDNRRWIIHEEKGLSSDIAQGGLPMIFKGVIKIPRKMQRMGRNDALFLKILTENHKAFFCVKCIYKFFQ